MLPPKFQNHWLSSSINLCCRVQFQTSGKYQKLHHFINRIQNQTSAITVQYLFYHVSKKYQSKSSAANFQIIFKNITFLKAANLDSVHEDLQNQPAIDDALKNMDNGLLTGVIYLDLSKAFDAVSHSYLLSKLPSYGINGNEFSWFEIISLNGNNMYSTMVTYQKHSQSSEVFHKDQFSVQYCFYSILKTLITVYAILVLSRMLTIL